jgi:hypothetical protein
MQWIKYADHEVHYIPKPNMGAISKAYTTQKAS